MNDISKLDSYLPFPHRRALPGRESCEWVDDVKRRAVPLSVRTFIDLSNKVVFGLERVVVGGGCFSARNVEDYQGERISQSQVPCDVIHWVVCCL